MFTCLPPQCAPLGKERGTNCTAIPKPASSCQFLSNHTRNTLPFSYRPGVYFPLRSATLLTTLNLPSYLDFHSEPVPPNHPRAHSATPTTPNPRRKPQTANRKNVTPHQHPHLNPPLPSRQTLPTSLRNNKRPRNQTPSPRHSNYAGL